MRSCKQITHYNWVKLSILMLLFTLYVSSSLFAQQDKIFIRDGNKAYENKKFNEAEKNYSKALNKNSNSYKGAFNLGDAYYKQNKFEEAAEQFQAATHHSISKDSLAKAYHNLGNSLLKSKKYEDALNAYKNALKNNPNDEDTRYNYSFAQQMLKQQQQQQKKDKDKKDKNDDKKKDKKEQDKKDENKKDEQKQDKEKQDKEKKEQQKISKEDAKRLLDALQNDEKNLQDKMKKAKVKGEKLQIEKDW